jgi:hypothetical protein
LPEPETGAAWVDPWGVHGAHDLASQLFFSFVCARSPFCAVNSFLLLTMSATDAWIDSLGEDPVVPSHLASTMTGLSLSSAYSGSSGEYGGVAKRANLLLFVDANASKRLCFGFVGSGSRRFCLKQIKGEGTTCGVGKHESKFEAKIAHFYLRSNDVTAF